MNNLNPVSYLTINNETREIVDENARNEINIIKQNIDDILNNINQINNNINQIDSIINQINN